MVVKANFPTTVLNPGQTFTSTTIYKFLPRSPRARTEGVRNLLAVSAAIFLLALGENLWKRFLPKYLEALGAPVTAIGLFGSAQDLLDGVYQYPGGWIGDRWGRRRALLLFVMLATIGYGVYWAAPSWPVVFVGVLFVMAWSSMASPPLFAGVGDALPRERRGPGLPGAAIPAPPPVAPPPPPGGPPPPR